MQANHRKTKSGFKWNDSPCSYHFGQTSAIVQTEQRFTYGSIYYPSRQSESKEYVKPETNLLQQFRKKLKEVDNLKKFRINRKQDPKKQNSKTKQKKTIVIPENVNNLYQVPLKSAYEYDRFGNRSHQVGDFDIQDIHEKIVQKKSGFSFGRRIDLSRPLNFVPGPGYYPNDAEFRVRRKNSLKSTHIKGENELSHLKKTSSTCVPIERYSLSSQKPIQKLRKNSTVSLVKKLSEVPLTSSQNTLTVSSKETKQVEKKMIKELKSLRA